MQSTKQCAVNSFNSAGIKDDELYNNAIKVISLSMKDNAHAQKHNVALGSVKFRTNKVITCILLC